jgi:hypothetical protein
MNEVLPFFLLLFLVGLWAFGQLFRYRRRALLHKERVFAMEKGIELPTDPALSPSLSPQVCLLRGLLWLLAGIAWIICLLGIAALLRDDDRTVAAACACAGIVPVGIGSAYLIYYRLQLKEH